MHEMPLGPKIDGWKQFQKKFCVFLTKFDSSRRCKCNSDLIPHCCCSTFANIVSIELCPFPKKIVFLKLRVPRISEKGSRLTEYTVDTAMSINE